MLMTTKSKIVLISLLRANKLWTDFFFLTRLDMNILQLGVRLFLHF
jgi:hypothetical protein